MITIDYKRDTGEWEVTNTYAFKKSCKDRVWPESYINSFGEKEYETTPEQADERNRELIRQAINEVMN